MKYLLLSLMPFLAVQQTCSKDSDCISCCDLDTHKCKVCICTSSSACNSKCCIDGVCRQESYCAICFSHEECKTKCCLQGYCNEASACSYFPIGVLCAYNYQCASYQCSSSTNLCIDAPNIVCTNHTNCPTSCCFNGKCHQRTLARCPAFQINMTCANNWDCETYLCLNSRCKSQLTGRCYSHEDCQTGCCINSRCAATASCSLKAAGIRCLYDYDCTSYMCINSKCMSRIGELCSNHTDCEYRCCINGICSFDCKYLQNGFNCSSNGDCSTYICKSGVCSISLGSYCASHAVCDTGFCMNSYCSSNLMNQTNLQPGEVCLGDYQCRNYMCNNYYCLSLTSLPCRAHSECNSSCCINFKCSANYLSNCNAVDIGMPCKYNWQCKSGLCAGKCLGLIGMNSNINENCASFCSVNGICVNFNFCVHKNSGEIGNSTECISKNSNGICLGNLGDVCLNRYNCLIQDTSLSNALYSKTCENHICKVSPNRTTCEVDEDCFYGYDQNVLSSYSCITGKCISLLGSKLKAMNCLTGCYYNGGCELYSYCAKVNLQLCKTHKDCKSGCCYSNTCVSSCTKKANSISCATNYDCLSFYCNLTSRLCQSKPCSYHQECMTGCCSYGVCSDTCNLLPALSSCSSNYQCSSNICSSGICKLDLWGPCPSFDQCQTGCCSYGVCKLNTTDNCPFKNRQESCTQNHECKSNDCNPTLKQCRSMSGETCNIHSSCSTGCCGKNLLCNNILDSANCQLYLALHECTDNYQCITYFCASGICKINLNQNCSFHEECASAYCNENSICANLNDISLLKGGDSCIGNFQCESFICSNKICKALTGEECNAHSDCNNECCGDDNKCISNLNNATCKYIRNGEICSSNVVCRSFLCKNGFCIGNNGEDCNNHTHCLSGYCNESLLCNNISIAFIKGGSPCTSKTQCKSFICSNNTCLTIEGDNCISHQGCLSGCCGSDEKCHNNGQNICLHLDGNSPCIGNYECKSYICKNLYCKNINGMSCDSHMYCFSGYCNQTFFCDYLNISLFEGGIACKENYQCKSYKCNSLMCKALAGESCSNHLACLSECCTNEMKCDDNNNGSVCPNLNGSKPCIANFECNNYVCRNGYCKNYDGAKCLNHSYCLSGYCNESLLCSDVSFSALEGGSACTNNFECISYNCNKKICQAITGQICKSHLGCLSRCCTNNMICYDDTNGSICTNLDGNNPCVTNNECSSYICENGFCKNYNGMTCLNHTYCQSGYCNNSLQCDVLTFPTFESGSFCTLNSQCISYICNANICQTVVGQSCNSHLGCLSRCCTSNNICSDITNKSACPNLDGSSSCSSNYECNSYLCQNSYCKNYNGESCKSHDYCFSGYCNELLLCDAKTITLHEAGIECTMNSQCISYLCNKNICQVIVGQRCSSHRGCLSRCCTNENICCENNNGSVCPNLNGSNPCTASYECSSFICENGYCKNYNGMNCLNHTYCQSEYCNENLICAELHFVLRKGGDSCDKNSKCTSYKCVGNICMGLLNEFCDRHSDCISDCCSNNNTCSNNDACPNLDGSSPCITNNECKSYLCLKGYCKNFNEMACLNHTYCQSNYCDESFICINSPFNLIQGGSPCTLNSHCISYICNNYICQDVAGQSCNSHLACLSGCCTNEKICSDEFNIALCLNLSVINPCKANYQCKSYLCDNGYCKNYNEMGCLNHSHCLSGYCNGQFVCKDKQLNLREGGNTCSMASECTSYICAENICKGLIGEYCYQKHSNCISDCCNTYCSSSSFIPLAIGDECTLNFECISYICADGICKNNENLECYNHSHCTTNYCNEDLICANKTFELYKAKSYCDINSQCESFGCINNSCIGLINDVCSAHNECLSLCCENNTICANYNSCKHLPISTPCNSDIECDSDLCDDGYCRKLIGESCTDNDECQIRNCKNNICQVAEENEDCILHKSCQTDCCYNNTCQAAEMCEKKTPGLFCKFNFECESFKCVTNYCDGVCLNHTSCKAGECCINSHCTGSNLYPECGVNIGQICSQNIDCNSHICRSNVCVGLPCKKHDNCDTKCCDETSSCGVETCSPKFKAGALYNTNHECASYLCKKGKCMKSLSYKLTNVWATILLLAIIV